MASEFDIIRRYFTRTGKRALLGVGDDCALVAADKGTVLAVSTDMLVEGRHFFAGADAAKLGRKALAVNLSDLAAMGAAPRYATLALALPDADEAWLAQFSQGFFDMADAFGVELIGGDTTRGPRTISITVMGIVPPQLALRRDGATAGDEVWLSGCSGDAALALAHLGGRTRLGDAALAHCLARLHTPVPCVALGLALRGLASSAIDVSDGLLADVGHIAESSGVAIELRYAELPRSRALKGCADQSLVQECLLAGGDDYELAFTVSPDASGRVASVAADLGLTLTRVGSISAGEPGLVSVYDASGKLMQIANRGFDHFGS
ncbi:MAG: thiamine-phosphate kinase [Betaproteobacteria bacterium]|nr:MAG: thiamine-phosphate kinase [Betaproteobacteria bacterium]